MKTSPRTLWARFFCLPHALISSHQVNPTLMNGCALSLARGWTERAPVDPSFVGCGTTMGLVTDSC